MNPGCASSSITAGVPRTNFESFPNDPLLDLSSPSSPPNVASTSAQEATKRRSTGFFLDDELIDSQPEPPKSTNRRSTGFFQDFSLQKSPRPKRSDDYPTHGIVDYDDTESDDSDGNFKKVFRPFNFMIIKNLMFKFFYKHPRETLRLIE